MRSLIVANVVLVIAFSVVCGACSQGRPSLDFHRTAETHFRRSLSYPFVTHAGAASTAFVEDAPVALARAIPR